MDILAVIAERRMREAMERGEFDDLPGMGKPLVMEDDTAESRMSVAMDSGFSARLLNPHPGTIS